MTLICHSKRFIFLKTRKTAGTALEMSLQRYCAPGRSVPERTGFLETEHGVIGTRAYDGRAAPVIEHMPARKVKDYVGSEIWQNYLKVANVRNPYEKLVSEFFWQNKSASLESQTGQIRQFREWLKSDYPKWTERDRAILAINNDLACDTVVRFEKFFSDVEDLRRVIGLPCLDTYHYKSGVRPTSVDFLSFYDGESAARVRRMFAFELSVFAYSIEGLVPPC